VGWLEKVTGALTAPRADAERQALTTVPVPQAAPPRPATPRLAIQVVLGEPGGVKLTGTTTYTRDGAFALFARRAPALPAMLEVDAVLQREPDNQADPDAVAVLVEGGRVAYLPSWLAKRLDLPVGAATTVPVQMFAAETAPGVRVEGWVWVDGGTPQWQFGPDNWPPMTTAAKRSRDHTRRRQMVADALEEGGGRGEEFKAGMVNGVHYLELVEPIQALKREGRLEEALELCFAAVAAAEGQKGTPPPWYTEQAAIVARKLGRREDEIEVLRRYLKRVPAGQRAEHPLNGRLTKLTAK